MVETDRGHSVMPSATSNNRAAELVARPFIVYLGLLAVANQE